jgi:hypothetical protein
MGAEMMLFIVAFSIVGKRVQYSPSPVRFAWKKVPDRSAKPRLRWGEGSLTQTHALELVETKGPHPAMLARLQRKLASGGHLLPPWAGEGQLGKRGIIQ